MEPVPMSGSFAAFSQWLIPHRKRAHVAVFLLTLLMIPGVLTALQPIDMESYEMDSPELEAQAIIDEEFSNSEFALAFALIENHYFMNKGFLDNENQLLNNIDIIRSIPAVIVQGRYDMVCPPETAYELSKCWPEASLVIAPFSGHTAFEKEITHELVLATNQFAQS